MSFLEVRNLSKIYGKKQVVKNISFNVEKGQIYTIIGPSGAGKTTLLRLIDILDTPSSGEIIFDGVSLISLDKGEQVKVRRRMGLVSQNPVIFNMSVFDNVAYGLNIRKVDWDIVKEKTYSALEMINMREFERQNALLLSGGEAQRIALVRTIVTDPDLLLLDEATANLDPSNVALIEEIIRKLNKEKKTTIVMATHNMAQAKRLGDKAGFLFDGEMIEDGECEVIFSNPKNNKTRDFIEGKMIY